MTVRFLTGDCRAVLPTLEAEIFDCIVTSPPYWGLRDYGTAQWEGGDPDCDHAAPVEGGKSANKGGSTTHPGRFVHCRCGARRVDKQIGLEPTLDAYVETMRGVARELWRVLKPSGTFWINLGDCYTGGSAGSRNAPQTKGSATSPEQWAVPRKGSPAGLKIKDLCGVPWRVAFALQSDGWWLRSAVVWHKPNPMPESVNDRPTSAYEMVFLLTKAERYFYDAEAIAEESAYPGDNRALRTDTRKAIDIACADNGSRARSGKPTGATRNARNVWTIATQPYRGAHFATMPPDLAERCIKAGCPKGGHVLDPFGGAGTTGLVADRLGRDATLIDLNGEYRAMGAERIVADAPLLVEIGG